VRASFEVSIASLAGSTGPGGVDPARAFRLLGVWTGPFIALPAACALLGQEEQPVADALEVLLGAHLLETPEPDVYRHLEPRRLTAGAAARLGSARRRAPAARRCQVQR
jgi:hypothetical protein